MDDERLEQLHRHRLGEAALVQPELRTHDDHRPAGIVHVLAEQVLPEPAPLALWQAGPVPAAPARQERGLFRPVDRKRTSLNYSHRCNSYAGVFLTQKK